MIAHPEMLGQPRRVIAVGRTLPARTIEKLREAAAMLRNAATVALLGGKRDEAQVALSKAELLEVELGDMERRGVPIEALFLAHGSEWTA